MRGTRRRRVGGPLLLLQLLLLHTLLCICSAFSSLIRLRRSGRTRRLPLLFHKAAPSTEDDGPEKPRRPRVIVVGGGVGGLAIASRLARYSDVTVLEKNSDTGGRCGSFDVTIPAAGTFRHERGPSLLLLPHVYERVFSHAGTTAADFGLIMQQCTPAYTVIFEDGDRIDLGFPRDKVQVEATLQILQDESRRTMDRYEPNGATKWDDYMRACEAFLDCGLPNFIEERLDLASFPAFLREALRDWGKAWPLKPHADVLDAIFESDKLRALASFQDLYVGLEPYRSRNDEIGGGVLQSTAPAVFGLLAAIELHPTNPVSGVFAPVGGFRAVQQSLETLATNLGVVIQCGTTVTSVTNDGVYFYPTNSSHHDDDASTTMPTEFLPADLVIVNADLPYAQKSIIDQPPRQAARYDWVDDKYRFSCGVIAFHWSVSRSLDDLNTHTVFLSADSRARSEASWASVRGCCDASPSFECPDEPFNFYVHRASKTDPSAAPEGMDSIMVLVPCKTLKREESYAFLSREDALQRYKEQFDDAFIDRVRAAVFHRLAAVDSLSSDLSACILDEVVDTPATYADQYNVGAGTPFALSHGLAQLSVARPGPDTSSEKLPNVLFCGASTRPGNGVPLVLIGAQLVAEKALSRLTSGRRS